MNLNTELDIWISVVQEDYPGLSRDQYNMMNRIAGMHYYFGDNDPNWNPKGESSCPKELVKLFEQFLVIRKLKEPNEFEY